MTRARYLGNQFYVYWPPWKGQKPIPWDPTDPRQIIVPECDYFGKVFETMEKRLEVSNLTIYLTNDVGRLPSYGQNVVAVILRDERCRIPSYLGKVRAVFKCYGTRPTLGYSLLRKPSYPKVMASLQFARVWIGRLPSLLNYIFLRLGSWLSSTAKVAPVYDIPLGYFNQLELPIKDMEVRSYDVSFMGSVTHRSYHAWSLKRLLGVPKSLSRRKMLETVNKISEEHPEFMFKLTITPDFLAAFKADARSYSQEMMDTKVCLVPRGASLETYRFFEALRYGCVVVTEVLPSRWFYDGSPAVQTEDWSGLERILKELVEDEHLMQIKHRHSLEWWRTKCSEAAVGAYIAEKLNSLGG